MCRAAGLQREAVRVSGQGRQRARQHVALRYHDLPVRFGQIGHQREAGLGDLCRTGANAHKAGERFHAVAAFGRSQIDGAVPTETVTRS